MDSLPVSPEAGPAARLLIVDDEVNLRLSMAEILRQRGYEVEEASSGVEALAWLERATFDLMVLDMVMPGLSGVEVMRRARQLRPDVLIIVLTAHATVDSAIAAVKLNVTDFLLKPCHVADLTLTISHTLQERARQLRRQNLVNMVSEAMAALQQTAVADETLPIPAVLPPPAPAGQLICVGPLTLDAQKRLATLAGEPARSVELTEGEVSVLLALMERPNQVLSCNQLANTALGYEGMDKWTVESVIRSCVFRLRQKIEPTPDSPRLICTVRGRGYFFSPA